MWSSYRTLCILITSMMLRDLAANKSLCTHIGCPLLYLVLTCNHSLRGYCISFTERVKGRHSYLSGISPQAVRVGWNDSQSYKS